MRLNLTFFFFTEINNRKILEDIQLKKQQLQKGVTPVVATIPAISTANSFLNMPHVNYTFNFLNELILHLFIYF